MTDRAAAFVRKSDGEEDDVGLTVQREGVYDLAGELADEVDRYDLGVHTGFSIHSRGRDDARIDANEQVQQLLSRLRDGVYDYLVAWDDRRLARDEYLATIERACLLSDTELCFVEDEQRDGLAHDVRRAVEKRVKQEEIQKAAAAVERLQEDGKWVGRPPFGFRVGDDGHLVKDDQEYERAQEALKLYERGVSYREIADRVSDDEVGISHTTVRRITERKDLYYAVKRS